MATRDVGKEGRGAAPAEAEVLGSMKGKASPSKQGSLPGSPSKQDGKSEKPQAKTKAKAQSSTTVPAMKRICPLKAMRNIKGKATEERPQEEAGRSQGKAQSQQPRQRPQALTAGSARQSRHLCE